ncbi:MAG: glycerol-3-phosphate acyltransferase, partial [Chloroflexota bacterium]|nr:glycerol-3-phosphate acyltransferase [Chloroflexota bacterium]
LAMLPVVIAVAALVSVPLVFLSRYMSLGSVTGAMLVPVLALVVVALFHEPWPYFVYALLASGLVMLKHSDNIARLIKGTERRI